MRMAKRIVFCSLALMVPQLAHGQGTRDGQGADNSLRRFVQDFYDWYVPLATSDSIPALHVALKDKASVLSSELVRGLWEDLEARSKVQGEIVGLDFDPFLSTQDPCERYEVGTVTRRRQRYRVNIHSVCGGKRRDKPDVVAELVRQDGSWVFVNFCYPTVATDLLNVLKRLREDRQKPPE